LSLADFQMSADLPIIPIIDDMTNTPSRTFKIALSNARAASG